MQLVKEDTIFQTKNVIALGTFDGLHLAHQHIVHRAQSIAAEKKLHSLVYTFSNLPSAYLGGEHESLFSYEEKLQAFAELGIDYLCIYPFDERIAQQQREYFMQTLLGKLKGEVLVAGYNFRFGKDAAGNSEYLRDYAESHGAQTEIVECMQKEGEVISSTRIRAAVRKGEMECAEMLLGRPYAIEGKIVHGREVGRTIGFPTANICPPKEKLLPPKGVYIARIWLNGIAYGGITNIGVRPTLDNGKDVSVETNILEFAGDIYGQQAKVELLHFLRPEQPFSDLRALREAIEQNKRQACRFFENQK